jgi:hypothetical protein
MANNPAINDPQGDKEAKEIERLRSTHNVYKIYADQWETYLGAYEGGPDFANSNNIFRHFRENEQDFIDRAKRLHYINYCEQLVDFFTNFIFSETIDRNAGTGDTSFYEDFCKNVDNKGNSIDEYMRLVSDEGQVFGMCYTLVDAPAGPEGVVLTKQQEIDNKIRPYWTFIRPDEILDWLVDDFDNFQYAKRRQVVSRLDASNNIQVCEKYTEFFVDQIRITEVDITDQTKPQLGVPQTVANTVGKIPLYVHRHKRSKRYPYMGNSFIRDFAYNNREIMNLTSLLQEFLYRQCFNLLAKEVDSAIPLISSQEGVIGTSNVIEYPKGATAPGYISPPADPAKFIQEERQLIKSEMFSRAAQDAMSSIYNGEGASGFSQAQSFSKTVPFISRRADVLEAAENALMALTMERVGKTWAGRVKYKDHYEITNVTDAMTQFLMLTRDLSIPSETFDKTELKRFVKEFDGKLAPDVVDKINREIEAMDYEGWKNLQEQALIGQPKQQPEGNSPAAQQKAKGSGTMKEAQAEAKSPNTAATKKLKT